MTHVAHSWYPIHGSPSSRKSWGASATLQAVCSKLAVLKVGPRTASRSKSPGNPLMSTPTSHPRLAASGAGEGPEGCPLAFGPRSPRVSA